MIDATKLPCVQRQQTQTSASAAEAMGESAPQADGSRVLPAAGSVYPAKALVLKDGRYHVAARDK